MIATIFEEGQGLGNQIWVYCAVKAIAETYKQEYVVFDPENFKGHHFLDIDVSNSRSSSSLNANFESDEWNVLNEECFWDDDLKCFSTDYDSRVDQINKNTIIRGCFQSEKYFYGQPERLKSYVKLKDEYLNQQLVDDTTCVIYIRGGEYKRHKNLILPKSYWLNAIENMKSLYGISKFIGISDDDNYFKKILPDIDILHGGMEHDFAALFQCKYAILANSSWGYFPSKLGVNKKCIIAPQHWGRFGNVFDRWASPCNLYSDWMWQDYHGKLNNYDECVKICSKTVLYYTSHYNIRTSSGAVDKNLRAYIPASVRLLVKKVLSRLLPKKFG